MLAVTCMRRKWQGGNGYWDDVPNEEAEMGSARMEMLTVFVGWLDRRPGAGRTYARPWCSKSIAW
jgi:hypothetical protein